MQLKSGVKVTQVFLQCGCHSPFTLRSSTSGIAPVRSGKRVYTEGVVSVQRDLKPESLHIGRICSNFDQHVRGKQSCAPNGFDLVVRLRLHQERDRFGSIQFDGSYRSCLEWFSAVRCGSVHVYKTR